MTTTLTGQADRSGSNLWISGLVGAALALTGSLALYGIARLAGIPLLISIGPPGQNPAMPLLIAPVFVTVAITSLGATAVYALLRQFFGERARRIFQVIALFVLLLSFGAPLSQDVSLANQVILALMHLASAAAIVWALTLRR
jgi:hypothetical protein